MKHKSPEHLMTVIESALARKPAKIDWIALEDAIRSALYFYEKREIDAEFSLHLIDAAVAAYTKRPNELSSFRD